MPEIPEPKECPDCGGSGFEVSLVDPDDILDCSTCYGMGAIEDDRNGP